jgi:hypothetical protein
MFATDRDLLALEPALFRDGGVISQRLCTGTCTIAGATLTADSTDVEFDDAAIAEGHIVVVDGASYEVVERLSATTLTISRLRASSADDPIPPTAVTGKPFSIHTFAPQIAIVHRQLLAMLGLEPTGSSRGLTEDSIVNPYDLTHLEALGALHLIYAALAGPGAGSWNDDRWSRTRMYQERFASQRHHAAAYLDTDNDSLPDTIRRFNTAHLVRT